MFTVNLSAFSPVRFVRTPATSAAANWPFRCVADCGITSLSRLCGVRSWNFSRLTVFLLFFATFAAQITNSCLVCIRYVLPNLCLCAVARLPKSRTGMKCGAFSNGDIWSEETITFIWRIIRIHISDKSKRDVLEGISQTVNRNRWADEQRLTVPHPTQFRSVLRRISQPITWLIVAIMIQKLQFKNFLFLLFCCLLASFR